VAFPYLREASFILSGYKGIDIWFAPIPLGDYGGVAQRFREVELTGTKITSVIKAEAFTWGLMLVCSFIFWSFFWRLGPIPSASYPYSQVFWPFQATWTFIWATATQQDRPWLLEAIRPWTSVMAGSGALAMYGIMSAFGVPIMWFYGVATGFTHDIAGALPLFVGAMLGRFYMAKRFGVKRWQQYAPVVLAGYACGQGLVGMTSIALAIVFKAVRVLPF
jgi:hypothetical protein